MALLQTLRSLVTERLSAAAEEICGSVEQIVAAYEDEACSLKQEIDRHRRLLDMVSNPHIKLHRSDDLVKDEPPQPQIKPEQDEILLRPEQHMNSSLLQEEPQLQQVKEEQEELLLRAKGGVQLLAVKHESDGDSREAEAVTINSLEHSHTQADVQDNGTPQLTTDDLHLSSHCSESDTEVCDELEETKEYQSGSNTLISHTVHHKERQKISLKKNQEKDLPPTKQIKSHIKKDISCKDCRKMFSSRSYLKSHMMTHTGERPFICAVCGRGCVSAGNHKAHMLTHTGERPFICAVCGKGFIKAWHLKSHLLTHIGERPFTCAVCGKGFTQRWHLKTHMMTHTGERPFTCTVCGMGCNRRSNLKRHMMRHH